MIGKRIKQLREWRDYSQCYMAARLGIDQSTFSRIERGRNIPDVDRLQRIAEVLDVPLECLLRAGPVLTPAQDRSIGEEGRTLIPEGGGLLERMLQLSDERVRELERLNHRLIDIIEGRRDDAA